MCKKDNKKQAIFEDYNTDMFTVGKPNLWITKYNNGMSEVSWSQDGVRAEEIFRDLIKRCDLHTSLRHVFHTYHKGEEKAELWGGDASGHAYVNHESADIIYNIVFNSFDKALVFMKKLAIKSKIKRPVDIHGAYCKIIDLNGDHKKASGNYNFFNIKNNLL